MGGRLAIVVLALAVILVLLTGFLVSFVFHFPPTLTAQPTSVGNGVTIHLETVAAVQDAIAFPRPDDPHPTWVSYLPTTILKVPANSVVTISIDQEDGASGLRNPYWGKAQGIIGGTFHMTYFDGNGAPQAGDFNAIDPTTLAHSFAIPDLGVFVPLQGIADAAPAGSHNEITFSFKTGKAGIFRWQCFVPCGAGSIYGNGNAMSTFGYMHGVLIVQ
ncbi:MAG TPA: hypothetical protein VHW94_02855 [Candidatus Dormibacteraeota bacterium]|nr:hypothetical protein [Candidatus Dormibacteraeota bacterium]